jgi:hypothetical protein
VKLFKIKLNVCHNFLGGSGRNNFFVGEICLRRLLANEANICVMLIGTLSGGTTV